MEINPRHLWAKAKFACASLSLCLAEIATILGLVILTNLSPQVSTVHLVKLATTVWIVGGLASLAFAVLSFVADNDRAAAFISLSATAVTFILCGMPMSV